MFFFIKSILYAKIMLSQKFWINYRSFTSVALYTQTLHQQWLHTRACYKNHRPATIMAGYKFEFKICRPNRHVSKILSKKSEMLKLWRRVWAKRLHWQSCHLGGFLFIHEIWHFHTKCRIFFRNRADQL